MTGERARNMSKVVRWVVLLLVSVVMATNYYAYDALSAIQQTLQSELGISKTDYGLIVAFYSFPNTFLLMAVVGGIYLDRAGIRKTGFLFTAACALGVILTAYATTDAFRSGGPGYGLLGSFMTGYSPEVKMMILGRLLFGLGAETSIVVINKIIAKWFKGRELAFAFGANLSLARMGTFAALNASPVLAETSGGWTTAVWAAAVLMTTGLVSFVVYIMFDLKADDGAAKAGSVLDADERFKFSDITDLLKNRSFVLISLLCMTYYSAIFPFQSYCPDILLHKFGMSEAVSGRITSIIIAGTIVFTPIFGMFVDRKGKRASLMIYGSALLVVSHLVLSLTHVTPYVAMFALGVAFSLVPASMWPSVALLVEEKKLGTAYGAMTSFQNLGLFSFPILAGLVTDWTNPGVTDEMVKAGTAHYDYTAAMLMFSSLGILGLIFAFMLRRESVRAGGTNIEIPEAADDEADDGAADGEEPASDEEPPTSDDAEAPESER
ncbi:MAG: MFS transporter [Deltaproteobacteria bacterium]|jgi:MFS family permease|nr:MFS transporter [Deltaproteobacteria bacterium]MBW2533903.1 MFS transporter [Deltaproteobacteria bacterium]